MNKTVPIIDLSKKIPMNAASPIQLGHVIHIARPKVANMKGIINFTYGAIGYAYKLRISKSLSGMPLFEILGR